MKRFDIIIFVIAAISVSFLLFGCSEKVPPNPTALIPVECQFAPIPPLKMMVVNPKDDVEIDMRIHEQRHLMQETLRKCKKAKAS
ncbi:MAG: hypothetical protein PHE73_03680 [Sulfurovaceae bacterium]|nr:hypothetical protein [Sulfurovaceae bacterium]